MATDNGRDRIAILNLQTGHRTIIPARIDRCVDGYRWSPNGRYLAFFRTGSRAARDCGRTDDLWVWDTLTGRARRLVRGAGGPRGTPPMWSHDSTRIAIAIGSTGYPEKPPWDTGTTLVSVTVSGQLTRYGPGNWAVWSPDDRLLAYLYLSECGNACAADERVVPTSGGTPITLARGEVQDQSNLQWARNPSGYALDRWILDRRGHPVRSLISPPLRADAWSGDGRYAFAAVSYSSGCCTYVHGDEYVVSSLTGKRMTAVHIHLPANKVPSYIPRAYSGMHALALVLDSSGNARKITSPLFLVTWPQGKPRVRRVTVPVGIPIGLIHNDRAWLSWWEHHLTITDLRTLQSRAINVRVGPQYFPAVYVKIGRALPVRLP